MTLEWKDLRTMNRADLERELARSREALRASRFRVAQNQEKKVHTLHEHKIVIARILTLLKKAV